MFTILNYLGDRHPQIFEELRFRFALADETNTILDKIKQDLFENER